MSATKPLCEGIANDRDHFANFFMQDTVGTAAKETILEMPKAQSQLS